MYCRGIRPKTPGMSAIEIRKRREIELFGRETMKGVEK